MTLGYCDWKGSAGIVCIESMWHAELKASYTSGIVCIESIVCIVRSADASRIPDITKDTLKNTWKVTESI